MTTRLLPAPPPAPGPGAVDYPESDGRPVAETDAHRRAFTDVEAMLRRHFDEAPDVYVSANIFLYYQEGEPRLSVAPDLFVVRGLRRAKELRRTYKVWEEGRPPDWVLELTSLSTRGEDLGAKRGLYEWLGVREYVLCDPLGEYLDPPLRAYTLADDGRYEPLAPTPEGGFFSAVLGLELRLEAGQLRLHNPKTGERLPTPDETAASLAEAQAEIARLRAEIERLRGPSTR